MEKTNIIALLSAVIIIGGLYLIINNEKKMVTIPVDTVTTNTVFKDSFMEGCIEDGTYTTCNCMYDKLELAYGKSGLVDMSIEYLQTNKLPKKALEAAMVCYE